MTPKCSGTKQPFSFAHDFVDQEFGESQQSGHHEVPQIAHMYMFSVSIVL